VEPLDNSFTRNPSLGSRLVPTDRQRFSRGVSNRIKGDKVDPTRLEPGANTFENPIVSGFITMQAAAKPDNPAGNDVKMYHKSTGTDTKVFVLNSAGTEVELTSSASNSLDSAYNSGSTITVDSTDVSWNLTAGRAHEVTDAAGTTNYLKASNAGVEVFNYTLPLADGAGDGIMTTDGLGTLSFVTIETLGDAEYFRLDGTNGPITGDVILSSARIQGDQGGDVASAGTITLGNGNYFDITGTTAIDYITTTDWQSGSEVTLQFDASVTVNHNTGSVPANTAAILLSGAGNFAATADDTLTLVYDGTTWREKARTII